MATDTFRLGELNAVTIRHLSFVCDGQTLKAISSLNKKFRHACEPALFRNVVIRERSKGRDCFDLSLFISEYNGYQRLFPYIRSFDLCIDRLHLDGARSVVKWLPVALDEFRNLTVLNIRVNNFKTSDSISQCLERDMPPKCPDLPNLKALAVYSAAEPCYMPTFPDIGVLLDKCSNLDMLKIDLSWRHQGGSAGITGHPLLTKASAQTIKVLHLVPRFTKFDQNAPVWQLADITCLQALFPDLEGLGLAAGVEYNKFYKLVQKLQAFSKLKDLVLCDAKLKTSGAHRVQHLTAHDRSHLSTVLFRDIPTLQRLSLFCHKKKAAATFERAGSRVLITASYEGDDYLGHLDMGRWAESQKSPLQRTFEEDEWLRLTREYL